ncbi:HEPN domain-containing protein [Labilibaculum sp.]|uniref:HEPN domain-containing protein n=1 Tax=Labilibaculum sp. TaxID=2060723 RepID=UPI002AA67CEE|nr:HEPN domain-containing protein [Labilibaculum sp.]
MISRTDLRKRAKAKLKDAEILYQNRRYDGAVYLSGYVMELILKARTCRTLNWTDFPETNREFQEYRSFKTHNLDILLSLSGLESKIKIYHFVDWSNVNQWNPEMRYSDIGNVTSTEAKDMIDSIKNLMGVIK